MKALTFWQPWATLVALGEKTIETRSWRTDYRGPLAIHAAKTAEGFYALTGDCEGKHEAGWVYGFVGDYQALYCHRSSDEGQRGQTQLVRLEGPTLEVALPLGAVVATATLVDCIPMVRADDRLPGAVLAVAEDGDHIWHRTKTLSTNVDDQLSYGEFRPGRWAWLLADIEPLDPPSPARGGQQLWEWAA